MKILISKIKMKLGLLDLPNDVLFCIISNGDCRMIHYLMKTSTKIKKMIVDNLFSKNNFSYYSSLNEPQRRQEFGTNAYLRNGAIYLTKVSFYDRVNNIKYSHDFIMNYNCTKMKPIKIMQGFIISDSFGCT